MTYVLSRQFEPDEYHATRAAALLKEAALRLRGVACIVWEQSDHVGPWVETETTEGAA